MRNRTNNQTMKTLLITIALVAIASTGLFHLGFRNVDTTKQNAPQTWGDAGYVVLGYEGYQWGPISGGNVWHIVERKERPGITYHGYVAKWRDEYHIYNLKAIDAISPN